MKITKKGIEFEFAFNFNTAEDEFDVTVQGNTVSAYTTERNLKFVDDLEIKINDNSIIIGGVSISENQTDMINQWHEEEITNYINNAEIKKVYKEGYGQSNIVDYITIDGQIKYTDRLKDLEETEETEETEYNNEEEIKENKAIERATKTNKEVLISKTYTSCNSNKECNVDIIKKIATKDGNIKFERIHTH